MTPFSLYFFSSPLSQIDHCTACGETEKSFKFVSRYGLDKKWVKKGRHFKTFKEAAEAQRALILNKLAQKCGNMFDYDCTGYNPKLGRSQEEIAKVYIETKNYINRLVVLQYELSKQ